MTTPLPSQGPNISNPHNPQNWDIQGSPPMEGLPVSTHTDQERGNRPSIPRTLGVAPGLSDAQHYHPSTRLVNRIRRFNRGLGSAGGWILTGAFPCRKSHVFWDAWTRVLSQGGGRDILQGSNIDWLGTADPRASFCGGL